MVSLYSLFVNDAYKPKKGVPKTISQPGDHYEDKRASQKKTWNDAHKNNDSYEKKRASQKKAWNDALGRNSNKQNSGNSSSGSDNYGSSGGGSSSGDTSSSNDEAIKKAQQKALLSSISDMKDSNISSSKKIDYSDLWNNAAEKKQNDFWTLKEEVFIYTFHDKQQHRYLSSFSIDYDKGDILGTCQMSFPYDQKLMEYWIPGKTTFAIIGGTFDREVLFVGMVAEIDQRGDQIEVAGNNVGWKFKPYMTAKFEKSLEGMSVKSVVKLIFKELGFTKGKYHIDLSGIPNIDKYVIGEGGSIEKDGETIQNVPELTEVVKNLGSYNIDKYIAKKSKTEETQAVASNHDKQTKMFSLDRSIHSNNAYTLSTLRQNYGVSTSIKDDNLLYEPILKKLQNTEELEDFLIKGHSGDGESTYEDILTNIASAIDAHFFIIDTTVCFMSFNALIANSSIIQKAVTPTIDFWQLQDGSYELDINQYGYYNTVKVKYKNGTVSKSYEDLVRVFGEMTITYDEPNLDYEAAMLKAQAYLSAHIRDFGMELKATILHTGKITPATFIKLKNPLTMSEGLFFVQGTSIEWSADGQTLISDLDLRFGPDNPDGLEVPEVGTPYSSPPAGSVSPSALKAAYEIVGNARTNEEKADRIYQWFVDNISYSLYYDSKHSVSKTLEGSASNCKDSCDTAYELFTAVGIQCQYLHGTLHTSNTSYGHYWLKIKYNGKWEICDLGRGNKLGIGKYSGKLVQGSVVKKNY